MQYVKIKAIVQETPTTRTLVLDVPAYSWTYKAGQFISLGATIHGTKVYRSYSLATSPSQDPFPAITIKRVAGGLLSNYLHDQVLPGSELICSLPQGSFTVEDAAPGQKCFLFIAAGSGIVPLFSISKALLASSPQSSLKLLYANHMEEEIIYHAALQALEQKHGSRFQVIHVLSKPSAAWRGIKGRWTVATLAALLRDQPKATCYFLCAPAAIMEMARNILATQGVAPAQIVEELFTPAAAPPPPLTAVVQAQATIHEGNMVHHITVEEGETVLDAAQDAGIAIPFSCGSGICNTCRAKCIAGAVHMTEDEGLSAEEKAEGYILTCVSYPVTPQLTLLLDS